jgi:hypothetical protein
MAQDPLLPSTRDLYVHGKDPLIQISRDLVMLHTVNLAVLTSSFEWLIQLHSLHISLFKVITKKYFTQSKCEFMNFIFVLLDKIKILIL